LHYIESVLLLVVSLTVVFLILPSHEMTAAS